MKTTNWRQAEEGMGLCSRNFSTTSGLISHNFEKFENSIFHLRCYLNMSGREKHQLWNHKRKQKQQAALEQGAEEEIERERSEYLWDREAETQNWEILDFILTLCMGFFQECLMIFMF